MRSSNWGDYVVSGTTMALIGEDPCSEYKTKIYDTKGIFYSKKTPLEILDEACMKRFFTYSCQIKVVGKQLGYSRKTPLIICKDEMIYTFPTCAPTRQDCTWIFPKHIWQSSVKDKKVHIRFFNGEEINSNCSLAVFKKQQYRLSHCFHSIHNR
ncbi:competence protein ComK [Bacillus ectoiniformans]|uniref:competence protein ComK n=1 Tax=Bacillus ectoiniformans TaxID=1494429 RepID=UPI00195D8A0C|nr:competence protein ComK [Bacillus ectoiniformans]MBM7649304.1 competence protein ComK [Bacillus ectoiniformans]